MLDYINEFESEENEDDYECPSCGSEPQPGCRDPEGCYRDYSQEEAF